MSERINNDANVHVFLYFISKKGSLYFGSPFLFLCLGGVGMGGYVCK